MDITRKIRRYFWKFGYDILGFRATSHPIARRKRLIETYNIDTVLDIGANKGQFAQRLRTEIEYTGRILSFEPLSKAFELLAANAKNDPAWEVFNFAIGDTDENAEINISEKSDSSSIRNMLPSHLKSAPNARYIGKELIEVKKLDSIFEDLCQSAQNIYMKIDTQGYESKVLKGAENSLAYIDTVQMEMSLIPLYEGEPLFHNMCMMMDEKGYTLVAIENGFSDPASGQLLQVDGIFHKSR